MAHSIQVVGNKHEILNDMDLLVLLGFLIEAIDDRQVEYDELFELRSVWAQNRATSGPGTIELALHLVANEPLRIAQFDRVLTAVQDRLGTFGARIPETELNERYPVSGIRFNDFEVRRVSDVIARLRGLVGLGSS